MKIAVIGTGTAGILSISFLLTYLKKSDSVEVYSIYNPKNYKKGFSGADDIADWFKNDRPDDWRQRD